MLTTRKIGNGLYLVYENRKEIGTINFGGNRCNADGFKKIFFLQVPKYNLRHGVSVPISNFKKVDAAAVRVLIKWLKVYLAESRKFKEGAML